MGDCVPFEESLGHFVQHTCPFLEQILRQQSIESGSTDGRKRKTGLWKVSTGIC